MKIYTERNFYECASAEQYLDGIHLLNEDGSIFVVITQPNRIQKVEDGEIKIMEYPAPTQLEKFEAQLTYTAMMTDSLLPEDI